MLAHLAEQRLETALLTRPTTLSQLPKEVRRFDPGIRL
jgi:hypothetical protein